MTYDDFIKEWENSDNFISVKTSGSTGEPKVINLPKKFMRESAVRTNEFFGIDTQFKLHSCISPDYIGGKMMAVRALISGASLSYENPSNQPLKNISLEQTIDLLAVVPSQMIYIINNLNKIPHLKNIIIGGGEINPGLRKKIAESGLNAFETYGMTETSSHIALRKVKKEDLPFKTLPGIHVEIDSEDCLLIKFETGEVIQTNDIARLVSDNQFYIDGRRDNIINSGGKKINPLELERIISPFISSEFYITAKKDEKWGETPILIIESDSSKFNLENLRQNIGKVLERWQMPKEIIFTNKLSRTPNGKIIRGKSHIIS